MQYLIPLTIVAVAMIVAAVLETDPAREYAQYKARRMRMKYHDIQHRIEYAPTPTELYGIEDDIIELYELYRDQPEITQACGELQAMLENKRVELRKPIIHSK